MHIVNVRTLRSVTIYITHRLDVPIPDKRHRESRREISVFVVQNEIEYDHQHGFGIKNETTYIAYHSYPNRPVKQGEHCNFIIGEFVGKVMEGKRPKTVVSEGRRYEVSEWQENNMSYS